MTQMTWRRFQVLLRGLGPNSLWIALQSQERPSNEPGVVVVPPGRSEGAMADFLGTFGIGVN